jgi:hypothetical protein
MANTTKIVTGEMKGTQRSVFSSQYQELTTSPTEKVLQPDRIIYALSVPPNTTIPRSHTINEFKRRGITILAALPYHSKHTGHGSAYANGMRYLKASSGILHNFNGMM